jgi:hypothetical protein
VPIALRDWGRRVRCRVDRLRLHALRLLFRFDPWHAAAPYSCRPYKALVVELANALQPAVAVEIGCGLGDIIGRVDAADRFGVDADYRVIRAARFLHGGRGRWIHGDGNCIDSLLTPERRIDCLIMVNWIHSLSPEHLADLVVPLLARARFLIVDAIDPDGPSSYRHKHEFEFLSELARTRSVSRVPGEPRRLIVFEIVT